MSAPPATTTIPWDSPHPSSIYKPVNSSAYEIRLLHVPFSMLRNLGQEDPKPLNGKLIHYTLPIGTGSLPKQLLQAVTRRNYTALSYVWGDPKHTHEIVIDGVKFPITYSLYTAIRQLQSDFVYGDELLWIDAICIDQSNNEEKSAQIGMMREVYHNAGNVRVWLGPVQEVDEDKIYQVMQWIQVLNDGFLPDKYEKGSHEWWEAKYLPYILKPMGLVAQGTMSGWHKINMFQEAFQTPASGSRGNIKLWEKDDEERFRQAYLEWKPRPKDLERFMKLVPGGDLSIVAAGIERYIIQEPEWFSRIWVVQEVGVAWDQVDVARGPYSQSWDEMLNTIFYLQYTCNVSFPSIDKVTGLEILRLGFRDGKRRRLRDLMYECRYRRATNPRDKIYGLYGLMGDSKNAFTEPNYAKSVEEVFSHTTIHFITQSKSLDIICGQQRVGRREGLPSWVPDYELDGELGAASLLPLTDGPEGLFNAAGFDERSEYILPDPAWSLFEWGVLPTRGIQIGRIELLSEEGEDGETLSRIQRRWNKVLDLYLDLTQFRDEKGLHTSLDAVTNLIDQYSAYNTTTTTTTSSPPPSTQTQTPVTTSPNTPSNLSTQPEINTTIPLILSYLNTLVTSRSTPTTRSQEPHIPALPPLQSFQTQTKPIPEPSATATAPKILRSKTSLFSIPRKAVGAPRAATMPTSSTSRSSSGTEINGKESIAPNPAIASIQIQNQNQNTTRPSWPVTSSSTTTATDLTSVPPHDGLVSARIAEACAALEAGMRRKRFFVAQAVGATGGSANVKGSMALKRDGRAEKEEKGEETTKKEKPSWKEKGILGSGTNGIREGDIVVVLFGCSVPVVLREVVDAFATVAATAGGVDNYGGDSKDGDSKSEGNVGSEGKGKKWMFIGEAFVDGFMDAEALAWLRRGRGVVEGFDLF